MLILSSTTVILARNAARFLLGNESNLKLQGIQQVNFYSKFCREQELLQSKAIEFRKGTKSLQWK